MRQCSKCRRELPVDAFFAVSDRKTGVSSWCRECEAARQSNWAKANREKATAKARRYRDSHRARCEQYEFSRSLRRHYNMTVEQYDALVTAQQNVCAVCMKPARGGKRLSVDHDHQTGKVRGLLCHVCNQGIGYFYDDPELLRLAAAYLLRHTVEVEI